MVNALLTPLESICPTMAPRLFSITLYLFGGSSRKTYGMNSVSAYERTTFW